MSSEEEPSIGFICPLYLELKAVLATFDEQLPAKRIDGIDHHYGRINNRKTVAVNFLWDDTGPGPANTSALNLLHTHPSLERDGSHCFLVGIAGGIWTPDTDVRLGDVVIATRTWDWRSGKLTQNGFVCTKYPERGSEFLGTQLGKFLYRRQRLGQLLRDEITRMQERSDEADIGWEFPGCKGDVLYEVEYGHVGDSTCDECDRGHARPRRPRADTLPRVHDGLVASGNAVLKDAAIRETLIKQRALAVEMEACGVPRTFIVVRGISDYADSHKNDVWQPYAAATAASCARLLINSFDGRNQISPASRSSSPLPPPLLSAELRAKLFGQAQQGVVPSGRSPTLTPPPFPNHKSHPTHHHHDAPSAPKEFASTSEATKNPVAERTQRLVPVEGILEEVLSYYIHISDPDATVERTLHPMVS